VCNACAGKAHAAKSAESASIPALPLEQQDANRITQASCARGKRLHGRLDARLTTDHVVQHQQVRPTRLPRRPVALECLHVGGLDKAGTPAVIPGPQHQLIAEPALAMAPGAGDLHPGKVTPALQEPEEA
tara:strand:- start:5772 stop:6161 length:390 start_codon:yes stop_codon:yes gene_type:complete